MSLLSKLKEAVVEEDAPSNNNVVPVKITPAAIPFVTGLSTTPTSPVGNIQTSDEMRTNVAGAGPSTVFSATLKSLSAYIPDEASRYKAAKDMLAAQGVTPATISADITSILARLDIECQAFETAKAAKEAVSVTKQETRIAEIDNQIKQLEAERTSVATAVVTAKQLIETKKQEFYGSANTLKAEYQGNLDKIKTYLGA